MFVPSTSRRRSESSSVSKRRNTSVWVECRIGEWCVVCVGFWFWLLRIDIRPRFLVGGVEGFQSVRRTTISMVLTVLDPGGCLYGTRSPSTSDDSIDVGVVLRTVGVPYLPVYLLLCEVYCSVLMTLTHTHKKSSIHNHNHNNYYYDRPTLYCTHTHIPEFLPCCHNRRRRRRWW